MDKKWTWPEIHEMVQQITFTANQNTMRSEPRSLEMSFWMSRLAAGLPD